MTTQEVDEQRLVYAAWERMFYALRDALRRTDTATIRYLAEHTQNNDLVVEAAQETLEERKD